MSNVIETVNLTKKFPVFKRYRDLFLHPLKKTEFTALTDVEIHARKGEAFALLGPNGAGKTTLIKILCTLVLPSSGSAYVNGLDVSRQGKKIRQSIGYVVSDERSFYWRLTGRQNLSFFAALNNMSGKDADRRIKRLLDIMELTKSADKKFMTYSTGMRQKLSIARGLLTEPEIIFMDEPTRAVDPIAARNLRKLIKEKLIDEEQKTILYATHNLNEVEEFCDRMAVIDQGKIKYIGSVDASKKEHQPKTTYIIKLQNAEDSLLQRLNAVPVIKKIISKSGNSAKNVQIEAEIENVEGNILPIIEKILKVGGSISSIYEKEASLEEVYSKIVLNK